MSIHKTQNVFWARYNVNLVTEAQPCNCVFLLLLKAYIILQILGMMTPSVLWSSVYLLTVLNCVQGCLFQNSYAVCLSEGVKQHGICSENRLCHNAVNNLSPHYSDTSRCDDLWQEFPNGGSYPRTIFGNIYLWFPCYSVITQICIVSNVN